MAREALETIREAEEQAKRNLEDAHAEAQRIIDDVKNRTEKRESSMLERERTTMAEARRDAREQSESNRTAFTAETERMAQELAQELEGARERAVLAVVDLIAGA
jgi:vacuolar-type H+-ATPase subunit H